jgi:hypothetical protein
LERFAYTRDSFLSDTFSVAWPVVKLDERVAVVAIQAVVGAHPEKSLPVLDDAVDPVAAEASFTTKILEAKIEVRRGGTQRQ